MLGMADTFYVPRETNGPFKYPLLTAGMRLLTGSTLSLPNVTVKSRQRKTFGIETQIHRVNDIIYAR